MTECRLLFLSIALIVGLGSASGCGRTDMGAPSSPGTGGNGVTGGDGGSSSGLCGEVPCLASLVRGCEPSGSCTTQSEQDYCYSNGVKQQWTATEVSSTLTVKRDSQVCYSVHGSGEINASSFSYWFQDRSGKQIASGVYQSKPGSLVVTCNDGKSAPLSRACSDAVVRNSSCSPGACTF